MGRGWGWGERSGCSDGRPDCLLPLVFQDRIRLNYDPRAMRIVVAVTDNDWLDFLAARRPDEVNFWRPRSQQGFHLLQPGGLFLFKLHSPRNYIAGGAFFVSHQVLPVSIAWSAFGERNGVADLASFRHRISKYGGSNEHDPKIGCIALANPFFLERDQVIPLPPSFKMNTQVWKGYDATAEDGARLWAAVQDRLQARQELASGPIEPVTLAHDDPAGRYGAEYLARARLGQGTFRMAIMSAYDRRCAITGERTLPALEAAHIRPYADLGQHSVPNGLLMRADIHHLFDAGYVTVTPDLVVEVSGKIREEFSNGRDYYAHHGKRLTVVPQQELLRPARELLAWHNEHRYAG